MDPSNTTENEITNTYMLLLQKTIEKAPEYWLWTHRRWKYSR